MKFNLYSELTTPNDLRFDALTRAALTRHAAAIERALAERLRAAIAAHADPQTTEAIFQSVMDVLTNTVIAREEPRITNE